MEKNYIMWSLMICTPHQIEKNKMDGACRTCKERSSYRVLVEKPEGKRKLGRRKRSWELSSGSRNGRHGLDLSGSG